MADRERGRIDDLVRAVIELALARFRLRSSETRSLIAAFPAEEQTRLAHRQRALVDRIEYILPRVAARLPWRADCLVQALAARRWLKRAGIASTLTLGVPRDRSESFVAHAWLTAGGRTVTGGDVSQYVPLKRP